VCEIGETIPRDFLYTDNYLVFENNYGKGGTKAHSVLMRAPRVVWQH
jgi:hypothetical protein